MTLLSGAWRAAEAPHQPDAPLLACENLQVMLGGRCVLEEIDLMVQAGEKLAVIGPNGAGKSTLFRAITGLLDPVEGRIRIAGHQPGRHICIAYLPQQSEVDWEFPATVRDVVAMGRVGRIGLFRRARTKDRRQVSQALERVGLAELADRRLCDLSGGQRQRMFLARALAQEAEIMLLDEPFNGLDPTARGQLLDLMDALCRDRVCMLVSMHDIELARERFPRLLLLNRRIIACGTPEQVLTREHMGAAFDRHLHRVSDAGGDYILDKGCDCGVEEDR